MTTDRTARFLGAIPLAVVGAGAAAVAVWVRRRRRRMDFRGKTVLISGASRGLGLELARGFAKEGARIVVLARDPEELAAVSSEFARRREIVSVLECDVRRQEDVQKSVAAVLNQWGSVDVLINNAGIIQVGPVEHMKTKDFADAMAVHFWGPLYLMQEVIPHMKSRRQGRIVNISSIGGKVAVPHLLPYVASKFALVGLSEGFRAELAKDRIYVTTVCPGLMRTGAHLNALFKGKHKREFAIFSIANAFPLFSTSSERAARQIINACRYGRAELIITPQARLLHLLNSLSPAFTAAGFSLVNRMLPGARGAGGDLLKRGWESQSVLSPSVLTRPSDRAAGRNNERPRPG
ncbi:MAG: SDR family NAD(P)-dependent oxidoreductase [Deltaproteobacteria bacterium]|nr:SDR family NAD(P)-dependent oxidoreductase [Deltaproteobacteria bacterium]